MRWMQSVGFVLLSGLTLGLGCQLLADVDGDAMLDPSANVGGSGGTSVSSSSSSSNSSSSSSSGMGGGSGTGGMGAECTVMADCKDTECRNAMACDKGMCVWANAPEGTITTSQLYGDCKDRKCDGIGGVNELPGDMVKDRYDWGNPCYANACDAVASPMASGSMMPCTTPWGNGNGMCVDFACVDCVDDTDCATATCKSGRCVLVTCTNLATDGNETDTDCGGTDCLPCTATKTCTKNSDCDGTCDMGTMKCAAPTCTDGVRNQTETDIDCGGTCAMGGNPAKCKSMQICLFPTDCESGVCIAGKCQDPTCSDYTQNQGETGIDCGGPCGACPL